MTGKKKKLYNEIFGYLNSKEVFPKIVMCDFESSVHNSLIENFPNVSIKGCFFISFKLFFEKLKKYLVLT